MSDIQNALNSGAEDLIADTAKLAAKRSYMSKRLASGREKPDKEHVQYQFLATTTFVDGEEWLDFTATLKPGHAVIEATDGNDGEWLNIVAESMTWMAHSRHFSVLKDGAGI